VLFSSLQVSMPQQDAAFGQPHNPAYMPMIMMSERHPLGLAQRVENFVMTNFFHHFLRLTTKKYIIKK
jgi:hypothetical protein